MNYQSRVTRNLQLLTLIFPTKTPLFIKNSVKNAIFYTVQSIVVFYSIHFYLHSAGCRHTFVTP